MKNRLKQRLTHQLILLYQRFVYNNSRAKEYFVACQSIPTKVQIKW